MRNVLSLLFLFALWNCSPQQKEGGKIVIISANAEWKVVKEVYPDIDIQHSPWGEFFQKVLTVDGSPEQVTFFHGGWGKVAAAGSTQYCIDRWHPGYLINIGTCGGFEGKINRFDILLVNKTIIYDILEAMGDSKEAIDDYSSQLDLDWLGNDIDSTIRRTVMVSADRDLVPSEINALADKYDAIAGDWETGAIAYTCVRNQQRVLILRGVTDLVSSEKGEAYDNNQVFVVGTDTVMRKLLHDLPEWIARCK